VKRGEVYNARLNPVEGSEQAGENRPVIIVTRDAINYNSPVVLAVPCTKYIGQRVYPSQVLLRAPDGGLDVDSVAMVEQVRSIDKRWLGRLRGTLSQQAMTGLERALRIALDLP
jgi:mRNA interferase MazF